LEIIRRTVWNFFRLENEHLNNCENFRVTNLVPLDLKYRDGPEPEDKILKRLTELGPVLSNVGWKTRSNQVNLLSSQINLLGSQLILSGSRSPLKPSSSTLEA